VQKKIAPNYKKLCGMVPTQLFIEFKKWCIDNSMDLSEGMEFIVRKGIKKPAKQEKSDDNSQ